MNDKEKLQTALNYLRQIDNTFMEDDVSSHYIDICLNKDLKELVIRANRAGLINLAMSILNLSVENSEWKHIIFDELGLVDNCDIPVIFTLKRSIWE